MVVNTYEKLDRGIIQVSLLLCLLNLSFTYMRNHLYNRPLPSSLLPHFVNQFVPSHLKRSTASACPLDLFLLALKGQDSEKTSLAERVPQILHTNVLMNFFPQKLLNFDQKYEVGDLLKGWRWFFSD